MLSEKSPLPAFFGKCVDGISVQNVLLHSVEPKPPLQSVALNKKAAQS
jgi:hypothetical protein